MHAGEVVEVDLLEGQRRTVSLPVTTLVEGYFGINGMMDALSLIYKLALKNASVRGRPLVVWGMFGLADIRTEE